jgi:ribonuclease R
MMDRDLLRHIERLPGGRAGYKQLIRELGLGGGQERRELREQLGRLTGSRRLIQVDGDHWAIPKADAGQAHPRKAETRRPGIRSEDLVAGRLDLHRDGYGFVRPNARQASGQDDIFIPPNEINGAMQGDQVLVEVEPPKADGRRMGRIVRDRAAQSDCGWHFSLRAFGSEFGTHGCAIR